MLEVLIVYEHKVREYFYCCLLQAELQNRGIKAEICHHEYLDTWKYKLFSMPKVVIAPCALSVEVIPGFSVMNRYSDFLRGRVPFYINLQAEQLFREEDADYNYLDDGEYRSSIYYICWGDYRRQQLLKRGVSPDHALTTGAVHLDFLRPGLKELYSSKNELASRYGLDASRRWVLFISSYTYAGILEKDKKWIEKVLTAVNSDYDVNLISKKIETSNRSRSIMLNWIERYLETYDDVYIYRIHPHERISEEMDRLAEKFPHRFVIVREEALQQWILASDYINVWVSTAIVDVYLAQKPCSVVWPIAPPEDSIPITMDGVETVSSYEIFAERNHGCLDGEFPIAQSKLHYYYNVDCPVPAYLQIADLVQKLLHEALPSCEKSKFTWKRVFTKRFILQVYLSFFAKHKIRFSNVFPVYRKKLKEQEDIVLRDDDIFFTKREEDICKRIRAKISQGNGESGTCQKF